jgi:predicted RNase H-like nuclease (RuvC/YqgF family)
MKFVIGLILLSSVSSYAQIKSGYLTAEDQKYYKNDSFDGNNQRERIDSNVKEINRLIGEMNSMKTEIEQLKKEVEELKKRK